MVRINGENLDVDGTSVAEYLAAAGYDIMRVAVEKNGDIVSVRVDNERATTYNNVLIRVDPTFTLEMHIDTDEANAAKISTGMKAEIVK